MTYNVLVTTFIQVIADLVCCCLSFISIFSNKPIRLFFVFNFIAFFVITVGDVYYNYWFRILNYDVNQSIGIVVTTTMLIFQLSQAYNWYSLTKLNSILLSSANLPYLIFTVMVALVLIYYFLTGSNPSSITTWYQIASLSLDMVVWFFAIICLARTRSISIILLTLGCLMITSADLTTRCLFMLDTSKLTDIGWIHIAWAIGVLIMATGFSSAVKFPNFKFCHPDSIQAGCSSWMLISSLTVFTIGFLFIIFFNFTNSGVNIHLILWNLPIVLMFIAITSVLLGNWFSNFILLPINDFLKRIERFNSGEKLSINRLSTKIHEFNVLGEFMDSSFESISSQLERETKIAAQVAHDIRSPLSTLEIIVNRLHKVDEGKRILLRDSINHIRDISNNLEKNSLSSNQKIITQLAMLLEYVISERRAAFSNHTIRIIHDFDPIHYDLFVEVIPTEIKRILTNIINNACDAAFQKDGVVNIHVHRDGINAKISIIDNGIGINDNTLSALFTRGFTTKKKGSGLGLYHARHNLAKWGGTIELIPNLVKGCCVNITIPTCKPPAWFVSSLFFEVNSTVICVDDCISIFHAWQEKIFCLDKKINLWYSKSKGELLSLLKNFNLSSAIFLVDFEFIGQEYTGFDLIDILLAQGCLEKNIYLVTSRSHETETQNTCIAKGIGMIPKYIALKIPLLI